jgi:hypothetical protein
MCAALVSLFLAAPLSAQAPQPEQPQPPAPATPPAPPEPQGPGRAHYGVRFGPSFTTLSSVAAFDEAAAAAAFEPTMNFGGFVNVRLGGAMSFQPEIIFASKGERIHDIGAPPVQTPSGGTEPPAADRVILVRYLEFPLLLRMSKQTHENTSLFLLAGPAIALRRNAVIREIVDSARHEVITDEVNSGDFCYIVGGGMSHRRWLVDARFTHGTRNIAVDPFPAPVKTSAFAVLMGARF